MIRATFLAIGVLVLGVHPCMATAWTFDEGISPEDRLLVGELLGTWMEDPAPGSAPKVAKFDLNGDGRSDYVVALDGPLHCGSHGCSIAVFLSSHAGFRRAADLIAFGVEPGPGSTGGVRDLLVQGGDGKRRWLWNGSGYQPAAK